MQKSPQRARVYARQLFSISSNYRDADRIHRMAQPRREVAGNQRNRAACIHDYISTHWIMIGNFTCRVCTTECANNIGLDNEG